MTKLAFLGPLPFFLLLYILVNSGHASGRTRVRALAVFAAVGLAVLLAFSQIIDWRDFSQTWNLIATAEGPEQVRTIYNFLPGFGSGQIFLVAELGFGALAALGWVRFLLENRENAGRARWLSVYAGYGLLLFGYRVAHEGSFLPFHYFFVAQAVLSVFFGFSTTVLWRKLGIPHSGWRYAIAGLAGLVVLHGAGFWAVVDARRYDAAVFESNRATLALVSQLGPTDRIALEIAPQAAQQAMRNLIHLHGIYFPLLVSPRPSVLREEFEALFVPVAPASIPADEPRIFAPTLGGMVAILHASDGERR
jgi:hypothetical protein